MDYTTTFGPLAQQGAEFSIISALGIVAILLWSLVWKGLALWAAARNGHKVWFIALLVLNTVGILEIIYYLFFRKKEAAGAQMMDKHFPEESKEDEPKEAL
ncbi:MAG: DUF5652 family protein [Patescibacteria group bacterium UBA2103]